MHLQTPSPHTAAEAYISGEPPLDDVLRDPIVRLLMAKDGVQPADMQPLFDRFIQ